MISELIYDYINCSINYNDMNVELPNEIIMKIRDNWTEYTTKKKSTNGEIFTVDSINAVNNIINFNVKKTTFDHYIYSVNNNFCGENICRSIASNILPLTSDNYYVLAVMSEWTSLANKIKFIGGAFSKEDICNNKFEPLRCIERETYEELGIAISNKDKVLSVEPKYFITRKNLSFINFLFIANLTYSSEDILRIFEQYKMFLHKDKQEVELESILLVKNDKSVIKSFINKNRGRLIDYMEEFFLVLTGEIDARDILREVNK